MRRGSTFLDARGWKRGWHGLAPMVTTKLFSSARNGGMSQSATARSHLGDGHADAVLEALRRRRWRCGPDCLEVRQLLLAVCGLVHDEFGGLELWFLVPEGGGAV
jgi:hypothetical protein